MSLDLSSVFVVVQIIAAPVSLGVDLTKDIIHKASNTLTKAGKAAASSVEKIRRASNDAIQTDGSSCADDTTTMPAVSRVPPHELTDDADETPTLGTALQRPQRRKYRPVDGLLDKDDDSASLHKVASDAAAVRVSNDCLAFIKLNCIGHTTLPSGFSSLLTISCLTFHSPTYFTYHVKYRSSVDSCDAGRPYQNCHDENLGHRKGHRRRCAKRCAKTTFE